jgi:hypothetical protein
VTLDVTVQQGNNTAELVKQVTLAPSTWVFVNTADVPQLQQAAMIIIHASFGAPSCDSEEAPMVVLSAVNVAAQMLQQSQAAV